MYRKGPEDGFASTGTLFFAGVVLVAASTVVAEQNHKIAFQPLYDANNQRQSPVIVGGIDPKAADALKAQIAKILHLEPPATESTYQVPKNLATDVQISTAVQKLKAGERDHCPTDARFRVGFKGEHSDPDAILCLQTDSISTVSHNGNNSVVFRMVMNPAYRGKHRWAGLGASFKDLDQAECASITAPLQRYGNTLVQAAGLPAGTSAAIDIGSDPPTNCDTWQPRSADHPD